jgi:hypothetical protein
VNDAAVPLNETAVALPRLSPVIATEVPVPPSVGLKPVMVGSTVNELELADPPAVVTAIGPVVAPAGTVVVIWPGETTVKVG